MSWDEVHDVRQPAGYNQPPDEGPDDWDRYEQKKEELVNDIWEMSVNQLDDEMAGHSHNSSPFSTCPVRLGKILQRAVEALAQERLEAYIENNGKGE